MTGKMMELIKIALKILKIIFNTPIICLLIDGFNIIILVK